MRKARVFVNQQAAGILIEHHPNRHYSFHYDNNYHGSCVSLTMPLTQRDYEFKQFPAFFDGLLPEGVQLESLLKQAKINRSDYFSQLLAVGQDMVGNVTVIAMDDDYA